VGDRALGVLLPDYVSRNTLPWQLSTRLVHHKDCRHIFMLSRTEGTVGDRDDQTCSFDETTTRDGRPLAQSRHVIRRKWTGFINQGY
jgi:hypothetical protein